MGCTCDRYPLVVAPNKFATEQVGFAHRAESGSKSSVQVALQRTQKECRYNFLYQTPKGDLFAARETGSAVCL